MYLLTESFFFLIVHSIIVREFSSFMSTGTHYQKLSKLMSQTSWLVHMEKNHPFRHVQDGIELYRDKTKVRLLRVATLNVHISIRKSTHMQSNPFADIHGDKSFICFKCMFNKAAMIHADASVESTIFFPMIWISIFKWDIRILRYNKICYIDKFGKSLSLIFLTQALHFSPCKAIWCCVITVLNLLLWK